MSFWYWFRPAPFSAFWKRPPSWARARLRFTPPASARVTMKKERNARRRWKIFASARAWCFAARTAWAPIPSAKDCGRSRPRRRFWKKERWDWFSRAADRSATGSRAPLSAALDSAMRYPAATKSASTWSIIFLSWSTTTAPASLPWWSKASAAPTNSWLSPNKRSAKANRFSSSSLAGRRWGSARRSRTPVRWLVPTKYSTRSAIASVWFDVRRWKIWRKPRSPSCQDDSPKAAERRSSSIPAAWRGLSAIIATSWRPIWRRSAKRPKKPCARWFQPSSRSKIRSSAVLPASAMKPGLSTSSNCTPKIPG